jgi:hypothetical protein
MAERLAAIPRAKILNDVVLNQVLVRLPGGDDANQAALAAIQREGACWLGGMSWQGQCVHRGVGDGGELSTWAHDVGGRGDVSSNVDGAVDASAKHIPHPSN